MEEAKKSTDWREWRAAINVELESLQKCRVFGAVQETPPGFNPVGYKWVFVKKQNDKGEVVRFKARLVAQGFTQRYGLDYIDTYSPVMDHITFRYLINFSVHHQLCLHLVDIVTAYLYGNIDQEIYMKVPEGLGGFGASTSRSKFQAPSVRIYCSIYGLKQAGRGVLLHQSTYIHKILKQFSMDKAHPVRTPMVVRSLDMSRDVLGPRIEIEAVLGHKYPYMAAIGALMYLANTTHPDIAFVVNLLARYSHEPTLRHWTGIKQVFRYLRGTEDMGLYFTGSYDNLIGYADVGFMSDPHKGKSQTGYVFLSGGATISWRSVK
ncbi:hypothetical protein R1flu_016913 [Riccia fluitans]|uniref:Reverse transcriptase Ty1/copia-type domain-containing protein n=1 Tax=Riccia fluitans TaxID=41844 RepID=A0ABD1YS44_9MARC